MYDPTRGYDGDLVAVGSVWYAWGDHQQVVAERVFEGVRQVRLARVSRPAEKQPWVDAWRVVKYGEPSEAYSS